MIEATNVTIQKKQEQHGTALLVGGLYSLGLYSSFMSSPWSTENFSEGDEYKSKSARRLVYVATGTAVGVGAAASWLDHSPWPFIGCVGMAGVMWYLYEDALKRGSVKASVVNAPQQSFSQNLIAS